MSNTSRPAEARSALGFVLLLAAVSVVACSGSGSPTDPIVVSPTSVASQSFQLINGARAQEGVGQLAFDSDLSRIARTHSEEMRDRSFFSHKNPDGKGLRNRLKANGVSFSSAGENLALVSDTGDPAGLAHRQLLSSPEHRDVMLATRFVRAGVGVAQSGSTFWITQIYLKP